MPSDERAELYTRLPAASIVLGDVLVSGCTTEGLDGCEGVHERRVRELAQHPLVILAVTQNDAGEFAAEVMARTEMVRILRPRAKKPYGRLTEELERGPLPLQARVVLRRVDTFREEGPCLKDLAPTPGRPPATV